MLGSAFAKLLPLVVSFVLAQECPEIPDNDIIIGEPVPLHPEDIPQGCSKYEILVARGTSEPNYADGGKFGIIVGDPIASNATLALEGVRGYPVQYPASSDSVTGTAIGARDVADRIIAQSALCPDQTFALVGYSQGAGVMVAGAQLIPCSLHGKIKSLTMFGNPADRRGGATWPRGLRRKVRDVCAPGDPVCDSTGTCFFYHLVYIFPEYIDVAVDYIVKAFTASENTHVG